MIHGDLTGVCDILSAFFLYSHFDGRPISLLTVMAKRVWLILVYPPSRRYLKALPIPSPQSAVLFAGERSSFYILLRRTLLQS